MSKLYAIRQTGKSNYWYDFVEDFTSVELDRNCISNNFTYVKMCQDSLATLNPAWKNSEIVEFRQLGDIDDFEDLYYKSIEQRADLEAKLAESEKKILELQEDSIRDNQIYNEQLAEKEKEIENYKNSHIFILYARQNGKSNLAIRQFIEWQNRVAIEKLEKVKWWCQGNAIQCFYNEAETEIKEKHIIVDRPQENGSPSLIKFIDNQIKQLKAGK